MKIKNNIPKQQQKLLQKIQKLPQQIGIIAFEHFDNSFEKQGFSNEILQKWKQRKKNISKNGKKEKNKGRGILILTGALRKSLKLNVNGKKITITSNSPYARIHNDGLTMKNGKKMPKRQFIGTSKKLNNTIIKHIENTLKNN